MLKKIEMLRNKHHSKKRITHQDYEKETSATGRPPEKRHYLFSTT